MFCGFCCFNNAISDGYSIVAAISGIRQDWVGLDLWVRYREHNGANIVAYHCDSSSCAPITACNITADMNVFIQTWRNKCRRRGSRRWSKQGGRR